MPDTTSSGESLPSGSHPSAQPEPAARFQSYAEYLALLDRSNAQFHFRGSEEQLWLASFTEDGRYIKRYTCTIQDPILTTSQPAINAEVIRSDTTVLSSSDFQTLLQTTNENVPYRIVITASNLVVPCRTIEDVLGLGLDLEPEIFDYIKSTGEFTGYRQENEFPLPWFKDAPALRIGGDVLCMLENTPERTSRTGTHEDTTSKLRLANPVYSDYVLER
ncbi:hypothetical protein CUC08_Gglean010459 [Alternaria sp. MG1]|uniref:Uncharacterized protein n=1 Tax=Alternaria gaisen TaxID=167740 RepID=A0ACB6FZ67_9PLEO|nr:hypothetical protein AG0111_0g1459 [Alternaria gaisen]RII05365.1 hypothetical protein CUC08_Gglean010459 [Alternaria sp. MG1]